MLHGRYLILSPDTNEDTNVRMWRCCASKGMDASLHRHTTEKMSPGYLNIRILPTSMSFTVHHQVNLVIQLNKSILAVPGPNGRIHPTKHQYSINDTIVGLPTSVKNTFRTCSTALDGRAFAFPFGMFGKVFDAHQWCRTYFFVILISNLTDDTVFWSVPKNRLSDGRLFLDNRQSDLVTF